MGTAKFPSISIFLGEIRDSESPALLSPRHKIMEPFVYLLYFQLLVPSKVAENSHQGVFRLKKKLRVNRIYFSILIDLQGMLHLVNFYFVNKKNNYKKNTMSFP